MSVKDWQAELAVNLTGVLHCCKHGVPVLTRSEHSAGEDPRQLASIAKYYTSEICEDVCSDAIQIHGGYGYTRDFPVEKFYRDSRVQKIVEGTSQIQKNIIYNSVDATVL